MLAKEKFDPRDRRHIKIGNRAEFLFPDDGKSHENGRNEGEQKSHGPGNNGIDTVEVLIVTKPDFNGRGLDGGRRLAVPPREINKSLLVDALQIAPDRFGAKRHGAVDPGSDYDGQTFFYVLPETRGDSTPAFMSPDCRRRSNSA